MESTEQIERRQIITGDITRREVRIEGKPHDINRLMEACKFALRLAAERGNFDEKYVVHADAPQEDEA